MHRGDAVTLVGGRVPPIKVPFVVANDASFPASRTEAVPRPSMLKAGGDKDRFGFVGHGVLPSRNGGGAGVAPRGNFTPLRGRLSIGNLHFFQNSLQRPIPAFIRRYLAFGERLRIFRTAAAVVGHRKKDAILEKARAGIPGSAAALFERRAAGKFPRRNLLAAELILR